MLALSGGGYRGLFTAQVLSKIEELLETPISEKFDLIVGTSIGGIIALSIASGIPPSQIVEHFKEKGTRIFPGPDSKHLRTIMKLKGFFRPLYKKNGLENFLDDLFQDKKMEDLTHAYAMVTCTSLLDGKPKFFKTPHNDDLYMDKKILVKDAAMATSAAPVYFPVHSIEETNGVYVDGGLVGNAPGLFGYIEAINTAK